MLRSTHSTPEKFVQPVTQYDGQKKIYRLVLPYTFEWGDPGWRKRICVPAGFEYDKASIPKIFKGVGQHDGPWDAASLIHDRMYLFFFKLPEGEFQTYVCGEWRNDPSPWTRKQADELLAYMGTLAGAEKWEPGVYKQAVRFYWPNIRKYGLY